MTAGLSVAVILGATATGKSDLALRIADRFDVEIVSADSRYLYRGMDVGTAKPTRDELANVPHHLVDVVEPGGDFSLASFLAGAFAAIEGIGARGRLPVVAGGTPLYLRALLQGWSVPRVAPDENVRAALDGLDTAELFRRVVEADPASAGRIGETNRRRLIRALEVYEVSGRPISQLEGKQTPPYRFLVIGLRRERETLYKRIDERVRWMFSNGLLDEARTLIQHDVPSRAPAMSAIGYPEARAVLLGDLDLETAIERASFATHRYVRHQETWFRRFNDIHWLDSDDEDVTVQALSLIQTFVSNQPSVTGAPDSADS